MGYGIADGQTLLVVDFGGGTLDLSLVRLNPGAQTGKKPLGFIQMKLLFNFRLPSTVVRWYAIANINRLWKQLAFAG
ncbi:MAG: hypothetical protein Fur006_61470 [Coleofasciculaceae cyanobacterium]